MKPRRRAETHLLGSMMNIEMEIMRKMERRYPRLSSIKVTRAKKRMIRKTLGHLGPKGRRFSCSSSLVR